MVDGEPGVKPTGDAGSGAEAQAGSAALAVAEPPPPSLAQRIAHLVRALRPGKRVRVVVSPRAAGPRTLFVPWHERLTRFEVAVDGRDGAVVRWRHEERSKASGFADEEPTREGLQVLIESEDPVPDGAEWLPFEALGAELWQRFEHWHEGAPVENDVFLTTLDTRAGLVTGITRQWTDVPDEARERVVVLLDESAPRLSEAELQARLEEVTRARFGRWHPGRSVALTRERFAHRFDRGAARWVAEAVYDVWLEAGRFGVRVEDGRETGFVDPSIDPGAPVEEAAEVSLEAEGIVRATGLVPASAEVMFCGLEPAPSGGDRVVATVKVRWLDERERWVRQTFRVDPLTREVYEVEMEWPPPLAGGTGEESGV